MDYSTIKMFKEFDGRKIGVFYVLKRNKIISAFMLKKLSIYKLAIFRKFKVFYEFDKQNNVYAKNISCDYKGSTFDIYYNYQFVCSANICLLGLHNIINVLLSVAMAIMLGLAYEQILLGISKIKPIEARLELSKGLGGAYVINNGYNSNIDSFKSTAKVLNLFNVSYRVIVTPGLIETGDDYAFNKTMAENIAKFATDVILVKEKNKNALYSGLISSNFDMSRVVSVSTFNEARQIINNLNDEYVVLIENDLPDNYI